MRNTNALLILYSTIPLLHHHHPIPLSTCTSSPLLLRRRPVLRCARRGCYAETTTENLVVSTPEVLPSDFADSVRSDLTRLIEDGKLGSAVEKLGFLRPQIDRDEFEAIGRELRRMVKCGNVEEAVDLIEKLAGFHFSLKELVEPFEIIRMCVKKRNPNVALRYARSLPRTDELVCTIILEFGKKGDLASSLTTFKAFNDDLSRPNMYAYRTIIDVCGLCGDHLKSRTIFEELLARKVTPNLYVFNSLMSVNACDWKYTMHIYSQMQNLGVAADLASYNILLKSCCRAARVDLALDIYRELEHLESKGSIKLDVFTYSTLVKVFADAKMWNMALQIKEKMLAAGVTPNAVTWSSLISACANVGMVEQAFKLFEEMNLSGCVPNSHCCNALLHACAEARQYDRAFRFFHSWKGNSFQKVVGDKHSRKDMYSLASPKHKKYGTRMANSSSSLLEFKYALEVPFAPTTSTYNILMKACGSNYRRAKDLMVEMKTAGLIPNLISWSTLIGVCGGSGNVESAVMILRSMRSAGIQPDVVAYTAAIKSCVKNKELKFAFSLFEEMKRYQIRPNLVTYNTLLRARSRYGSLEEVQQCLAVYLDMRKSGYKSNDYYLKLLIEEWCEGILQHSHKYQSHLNSCDSDLEGPQSLLLEKVATNLQNIDAETQTNAVDLRGLTKVEARIVVLAVLRMFKENYTTGNFIKDDLLIIIGNQEIGTASVKHKSDVKEAIIRLLRDELGLEVVEPSHRIHANSIIVSAQILGRNGAPSQKFSPPTRRPAVLQRLKVTKRSLCDWLQKKRNFLQRN